MTIMNISVLKKNLASSIDSVIDYNDSITVVAKKGNAVIVSEEEYNNMLETLRLTFQKVLSHKIKNGEKEDIDEMTSYNPDQKW